MFKHVIVLIIFTFVVVFFQSQLSHVLYWFVVAYQYVQTGLSAFIADDATGKLLKTSLALLAVPLGSGIVVGLVMKLFRGKALPYATHTVWLIWVLLLAKLAS